MKNLERSLHDHELIVLRVIGEWWDLDLTGVEKRECIQVLVQTLANLDLKQEIEFLGPEEAAALKELALEGGQMPVAAYERKHGLVRRMGPGKMEREEPWLDPVSPAEALWYRGFLYQAFDELADNELVEYYYLPEELNRQFDAMRARLAPGRNTHANVLEPVEEPAVSSHSPIDSVDDLTTILALAQQKPLRENNLVEVRPFLLNQDLDRASLLLTLAWELQLLRLTDDGARPARSAVSWLKKSRESQLRDLADAWSKSSWNELCHTPGLLCDGSGWENDPLLPRAALLDSMPRSSEWFNQADLIGLIKQEDPDFQRPDGNYDTWYIRREGSDLYITGFENWENVEGRLLAFILNGSMYWLGLLEIAGPEENSQARYRLSNRMLEWLENRQPVQDEVSVPIVVHDDAVISVPFNADRYQRFQVARVSEPEPVIPGAPYRYQLTPRSLAIATDQGIDAERLISFLVKAAGRPLPISTDRAIRRWEEKGTEARLLDVVILRVADPEILVKLREQPRTRPYLGEVLGDLAVVVRKGDWPELRKAAASLGLLLDYDSE